MCSVACISQCLCSRWQKCSSNLLYSSNTYRGPSVSQSILLLLERTEQARSPALQKPPFWWWKTNWPTLDGERTGAICCAYTMGILVSRVCVIDSRANLSDTWQPLFRSHICGWRDQLCWSLLSLLCVSRFRFRRLLDWAVARLRGCLSASLEAGEQRHVLLLVRAKAQ